MGDDPSQLNENPRTQFPWSWLAALSIGVALARWLFAADRRVFHLFPDEAAQLAMGRWLGGGTPWKLFDHSTWQPGFAILLAPIYAVTDDPVTVFRVAICLNACVAAASAVLLAFVARRLTNLSMIGCIGAAAIVSLLPASLSASAHAWAEPLVSLTFLGSFLALARYVEREEMTDGLIAVMVGVIGFLAHGRLLPMAATAGLVVLALECRRRRWRRVCLVAVVFASAIAAVYALTAAAQRALWDAPDRTNSISATLRRFAQDPLALVDTLVGQSWYLLVTTAGISFVGLWAVCSSAFKTHAAAAGGQQTVPNSTDARLLLELLLPQLALSVLFTSDRGRVDQVMYGRYNDAVVLPVLIVGIAWFVGAAGVRWRLPVFATTIGVTLATTAYLAFRFGSSIDGDGFVREMVPGLAPFYGSGAAGGVAMPAVLGLIVLFTLGLTTFMPRLAATGFAAVATALVAIAAMMTHHGLAVDLNHFESAKQVEEVRAMVPPGETIGFRFVPVDEYSLVLFVHQRFAAQLYQMYLPEHEFVRDEGPNDDVGPYVFAPRLDPALLDAGAVALWEADDTGMTLWREQR